MEHAGIGGSVGRQDGDRSWVRYAAHVDMCAPVGAHISTVGAQGTEGCKAGAVGPSAGTLPATYSKKSFARESSLGT